jgi:hypothetical protein
VGGEEELMGEGLGIRRASVDVAPSLIVDVLHMPENCLIVGAVWNFDRQTLRLYVECPDLDVVGDGAPIPNLIPTVRKTTADDGAVTIAWEWYVPRPGVVTQDRRI